MTNKIDSILIEIIERNRQVLHKKIEERRREMSNNNVDHYKLYELLGFSSDEGYKIDLYQNIGRFV